MVKRPSRHRSLAGLVPLILILALLLGSAGRALAYPRQPKEVTYDGDPGDGVLSPEPQEEPQPFTNSKPAILDLLCLPESPDRSSGCAVERTVFPLWRLGSAHFWFLPPVCLPGGGNGVLVDLTAIPGEGRWQR